MFRIQKKMGITTYEHKISSALYTTTSSITAKCSSFVKVPHVPPEHVLGGVGGLGAVLAGTVLHALVYVLQELTLVREAAPLEPPRLCGSGVRRAVPAPFMRSPPCANAS